jgi:hypothetical protein
VVCVDAIHRRWHVSGVVVAIGSAFLLAGLRPLVAVAVILAIAGLNQSAFVLAVRRHFTRGDLVLSSP